MSVWHIQCDLGDAVFAFLFKKRVIRWDSCFTELRFRRAVIYVTETHLSKFSPFPPCFPACVSESRTWSMYKFYVKALIVGFLFPSVMPFCPKEVQSFYQVSWARPMVAPRQLSSDTVNAVLYIWKCTCILSFKTLQGA